MGRDAVVQELDRWARASLAVHRKSGEHAPTVDSVSPWSVAALVASVHRFTQVEHGEQWLWATAAIANLGELLFCAEDGGLKRSAAIERDRELRETVDALRTVRNVCFHPAFQKSTGNDTPHMLQLIELLENDDRDDSRRVAIALRKAWSSFTERPATAFALGKLNGAGILLGRMLKERRQAFVEAGAARELDRLLSSWRRR